MEPNLRPYPTRYRNQTCLLPKEGSVSDGACPMSVNDPEVESVAKCENTHTWSCLMVSTCAAARHCKARGGPSPPWIDF